MGIRQTELSDLRIVSIVAFVCSVSVLAAATSAGFAIVRGSSELLRWPFRMICHGQLDRAFEIMGVAMPLCARCTGIYAGIALAAAVLFVHFPGTRTRIISGLGLVLAAPMLIDGTMQMLGVWSTGNIARAATGLGFGTGLVLVAASYLMSGSSTADGSRGRSPLGFLRRPNSNLRQSSS